MPLPRFARCRHNIPPKSKIKSSCIAQDKHTLEKSVRPSHFYFIPRGAL